MEKNVKVTVKKNDLFGEDKKIIRSMHYLRIETEVGAIEISVGEKTYNKVRELTNKEAKK